LGSPQDPRYRPDRLIGSQWRSSVAALAAVRYGLPLQRPPGCPPSFWRRWARKDLRPGDLIALWGLTTRTTHVGLWSGPYPDRLQRLRGRGFIEEHEGNKPPVTMKGRVALLLGQPI
jgi:hypothetical protein